MDGSQPSPNGAVARLTVTPDRARIAIVVCFALASLALYYPGTLGPDSSGQLQEAISGNFTDWHPPIMAALWRLLLHVAPGPAPLLVLQVALYWIGIWAFWDAVAGERNWHSFLPLLAAAHPLLLVSLGTIGKDVSLATSLTAAAGILYRQRALARPANLGTAILVGLLLAYAALVRWNGAFAVAPLLLYRVRPAAVRAAPVLLGSAVLALVSVPVSTFVNHSLLQASPTHPEVSLELFDTAGIVHFSGDRRLLGLPDGCYTPFFWDPLKSPRCDRLFDQWTGPGSHVATTRTWISAIASHPLSYARHRLDHFNSSIYFLVPPAQRCRSAPEYFDCNEPRARLIASDFVKKNPLYWPCVWLAAGAWLLVRRRGAAEGIRALAWSGTLYGVAYLVVRVATDWRYYLWTVFAIAMALALDFASAKDTRPAARELALVVLPVVIAGYAARLIFMATA